MTTHIAALEPQRHLQSLIENLQSEIGLPGWRNHRFHNVPFRFKKQSIYERKTGFFTISIVFATGE
jgi:hypothetical protein